MSPETKITPIPVTILTGFLGSGKTTLLNHIIKGEPTKRFAVIENEFGKIPIDNELVIQAEEDLFTLENGCICCSLQSDILDILVKLAARKEKVDHVLIESTGVADPAPVAQLFINNMELQHYYSLDGVICLVDAINFNTQVKEQPETIKQISMADIILINKTDKATAEEVALIAQHIRLINTISPIEQTSQANIDLDKLLTLKAYDLEEVEKTFSPALSFSPVSVSACMAPLNPTKKHHHHTHSVHDIQTFSMEFKGALNFIKFNNWFNYLTATQGHKLYRAKGILHSASSDKKIIFQSVHHEIDGMEGNSWGNEPRESKMVFIGRNLDEKCIRKEVLDCIESI